jgi:hypothetical protein
MRDRDPGQRVGGALAQGRGEAPDHRDRRAQRVEGTARVSGAALDRGRELEHPSERQVPREVVPLGAAGLPHHRQRVARDRPRLVAPSRAQPRAHARRGVVGEPREGDRSRPRRAGAAERIVPHRSEPLELRVMRRVRPGSVRVHHIPSASRASSRFSALVFFVPGRSGTTSM